MLLKTYYKRDKTTQELKVYHMVCVCQTNKDGTKIYASEFIDNYLFNSLKVSLGIKEIVYGKEALDND